MNPNTSHLIESPLVAATLGPDGIPAVTSPEFLQQVLHSVRDHMGLEVAFISELRDGQRFFRFVDEADGAPRIHVGDSDPAEESYCQRVVDGRLPELITNAVDLPAACDLLATLELPIGAHLSVPIRFSDGRVFGTLCCFDRKPDKSLNERDLDMMRVFADFVARQLERDEAIQSQRREKRDRVQALLDTRAYRTVLQPICNIEEHRVAGYEALARFDDESGQGPQEWLLDAAEVGLREELELALMERALEHLPALPADLYISLNASPEVIQSGRLHRLISRYPLDRIMLEVTEHDAVEDYELLADALYDLRQDGVRLAIDDAGAGFASFRHIVRLRPNLIKIDRSLVHGIATSEELRALAEAFNRYADETGGKVVAEGVETEHDLDVLRRIGIYKAQGYLLGRPVPLEQLDLQSPQCANHSA